MKATAPTLLDTSAWLAALLPSERHHQRSRAAYEEMLHAGTPLLTTNLIVAEMHVLLGRERHPAVALDFLDALYADLPHEVVHVDRDLELSAIDRWMRPRPEMRLSLADATAFELAQRRGVHRALSLDQHFSIAGLSLLP